MTLLAVVQSTTRRIGIPYPSAVASSNDDQLLQLMDLANEEIEELADRYPFQAIVREQTFTTVGSESQGTLSSIISGESLKYVLNQTMWNRTQRRPVFNAGAEQKWQWLKARNVTGPYSEYRIREDTLRFIPTPTSGETVAFEYVTNYLVLSVSSAKKATFTADDDTTYLDEKLVTRGVIWRWKKVKGLDYAEDFAAYERMVTNAIARDGTKPRIDMGEGGMFVPGISVPEGSWSP